jgi:hypothetical protein
MTTAAQLAKRQDSGMAITAMVLGTLSVTGFGLLFGIPAIILASIALKNKASGRELSIAGLVTGIVGTVFSLLFFAFIILAVVFAADEPSDMQPYPIEEDSSSEQVLNPSRV